MLHTVVRTPVCFTLIVILSACVCVVSAPLFVYSDGLSANDLRAFVSGKESTQLVMNLPADLENGLVLGGIDLHKEDKKLQEIESKLISQIELKTKEQEQLRKHISTPPLNAVKLPSRKIIYYEDGIERETTLDLHEDGKAGEGIDFVVNAENDQRTPDEARASLAIKPPAPDAGPLRQTEEILGLRSEHAALKTKIESHEAILHSIDESLRKLVALEESSRKFPFAERQGANQRDSAESRYSDPNRVSIIADRATFYTGPAQFDSPLLSLPRGTDVTLMERQGEWCRVELPNGIKAWVRGKNIG